MLRVHPSRAIPQARRRRVAIMTAFPHRPPDRKGFSLLEILAACAIIALLAAILFAGASGSRAASRTARCVGNLRQIHQALMLYHAEHQGFAVVPTDRTLKQMLAHWLDSKDAVFHCPEDGDPSADSYSYFYVPRTPLSGSDRYVLGCSRHQRFGRGVAVFTGLNVESSANAVVTFDDGKTPRRAMPGETFGYGTLLLADGSTISIGAGQGGGAGGSKVDLSGKGNVPDRPTMSVLYSSPLPNGHTHTIIRMEDGELGTVKFDVQEGNRFEVATPAAVIAVRGTQFQVTVLRISNKPATRAEVTSGEVDMDPVGRGHGIRLKAGGASKGFALQGQEPVYE